MRSSFLNCRSLLLQTAGKDHVASAPAEKLLGKVLFFLILQYSSMESRQVSTQVNQVPKLHCMNLGSEVHELPTDCTRSLANGGYLVIIIDNLTCSTANILEVEASLLTF